MPHPPTPPPPALQLYEEAGTDLAQALSAKDTLAKQKAAMAPDVAKALARVSGGLYIVTAAHTNAKSAMVASWVSQASFEPLGLTIAVAKDRAIESLMQVRGGGIGCKSAEGVGRSRVRSVQGGGVCRERGKRACSQGGVPRQSPLNVTACVCLQFRPAAAHSPACAPSLAGRRRLCAQLPG